MKNSIPLTGGGEMKTQAELQPGMTVLFEDKVPGANWGHPGAVHVIDATGKEVETLVTSLPPTNLKSAALVAPPFPVQPEVKIRLNDLGGKFKVAHPETFHALLINGNSDDRHWNDFTFLYETLTKVYGYNPDNIRIADSVHLETSPLVRYSSTVSGVTSLFEDLKTKLTMNDHLLIAVNDHGYVADGESTLVLHDGVMTANQFAKKVNELPVGQMIALYEQCFGGGFVRPTVGQKRVAMSASTNEEFSWANADLTFDEFLYHVISAFAGQTHNGAEVNADINGDGKISAQEAFAFATARDTTEESPLMEGLPNAGTPTLIGLGF